MSNWKKGQNSVDDDDEPYYPSDEGQACPRCRQEYTGTCVLNVPNCPFEEEEEDPFADEDEKGPDFEDVPNLNTLLEEDKEAEKLVEEEPDGIPIEDLLDDEKPADDTRG